MYLKKIEVVGFKSFANRTKLDFERGMTAIVGPNGCGKSNIADAIRWVLGEQSAKAMRGSKMEDCIFNGTDSAKALNMAEVSLTLAECEHALETEYNEITVTRRVFRSGEGQYLINKTPCRLKDIQRLFMDTGIGTNSYSLMEQGRIDRILSSRPEDRRAVFEEASGITKFKADKKEALRKLDHTEANLLRLDDIVREVKRQIISLQRQAGKARRYKDLQTQLRAYDIYATRQRMGVIEKEIKTLETKLASLNERDEAMREDSRAFETKATELRAKVTSYEEAIAAAVEASVQTKTDLDRTREQIRTYQERIEELISLSARDSRDAEDARKRLEQHRGAYDHLADKLKAAEGQKEESERELDEHQAKLAKSEAGVNETNELLQTTRSELVDLESRTTHTQNELADLDAQERGSVLRRERLAAEESNLKQAVEVYGDRQARMRARLDELFKEAEASHNHFTELKNRQVQARQEIEEARQNISALNSELSGRKAEHEVLRSNLEEADQSEVSAKALRDDERLEINPNVIIGSLNELIEVEPAYRKATDAALLSHLNAIVVADSAFALQILQEVQRVDKGSTQLLSVQSENPAPLSVYQGPGERLLEHITCEGTVQPLLDRLLQNVFVVDKLDEVPQPLPWDVVYVTHSGSIMRGTCEFEYVPASTLQTSPLARREQFSDAEKRIQEIEALLRDSNGKLEAQKQTLAQLEQDAAEAAQQSEEHKRNLALAEGENQILSQEAQEARDRTETVSFELNALAEQGDSGHERREALQHQIEEYRYNQDQKRQLIATKTEELKTLEQERSRWLGEVTERRVRAAERRQEVEHLSTQRESLEGHMKELEEVIQERSEGANSYQVRIEELRKTIAESEQKLEPLQADVHKKHEELEAVKKQREETSAELEETTKLSSAKRDALDELRSVKGQVDVELAEKRMRHQNIVERVCSDYRISREQMMEEEEPEWDGGKAPDLESIETTVAEHRAKLESIGPVNLVAIEEHDELQERYEFLTAQQEDLVKSKQQLMDMIRKINKTTTELFTDTFNKVNANFQVMFKQLFGGGSAKLVLVDEEDILESGIEIIARPPGKKLQTVSLLSGGERTMTAVGLLFSLYQVKPSPFCVLDELDAALDDANIGRFVEMLKGFLHNSQFIVITHNRQTIGAADVLYGVTMEQRGISKIVSVKFADHEKQKAVEANTKEEAPAPA